MIRIYVEGQELVIRRETSMTVELNNALFASPDIEGDVSFTFTLPVEGNERLLGFPSLPQCGGVRALPCTVYYNGSHNWNGQLIVQKASHDSLSAALVINPYPDGFGKRSLTENEDGEIVVSDSLSTHDTAWEQFLVASVQDPDVKFAPFFNKEGYGSDNDNWGFWNGLARRKIVNALLFDGDGNIIDNTFSTAFSKAHNQRFVLSDEGNDPESGESTRTRHIEFNQLAFCPQIRMTHIFELWCRNAGYKFINHLGENLNGTFIQSQKSLDGTMAQYDSGSVMTGWTNKFIHETSEEQNWDYAWWNMIEAETGQEIVTVGAIYPPAAGWYKLTLMPKQGKEEMRDSLKQYDDTIMRHGYKVAVYYGYKNLQMISEENTYKIETIYAYDRNERIETHNPVIEIENLYVSPAMMAQGFQGIRIVIYMLKNWGYERYIRRADQQIKLKVILELKTAGTGQYGLNIFRSRFRIPELLPDVTNSSYMKTMLDTFGLCYYISAKTKNIELVPYAALEGAKSIDLTEWELTRETEVQTPEETMQTFRLKPLKDEGYNENLRMPDREGNNLPDAYFNHEHFVLMKKTNTLYHATVQEHEDYNWTEGWMEHSGNPDSLVMGNGEESKREPGVSIPHQRFFGSRRPNPDAETGETPQLMVVDTTICSDLYNVSDKPSDIILTQYRGFRRLAKKESVGDRSTYIYKEVMLPVWNGEFSLTAKGANSLGEKYVKPVLELANHKTVTYKLRLPANMMQPVEDLLRPSDLPPERQTRFIVIRNVKTVPKKITFQIDNDRDDTVLCQIEAVKVY